MCDLHRRCAQVVQYLDLLWLLDSLPPQVRKAVARKREEERSSTSYGGTPERAIYLALPSVQMCFFRGTSLISLLVWKGCQPSTYQQGLTTSLLRANLLEAETNMPTSLLTAMPCWTLPTLRCHRSRAVMLLRQEILPESLPRNGLPERMELPRGLRRYTALWRSSL